MTERRPAIFDLPNGTVLPGPRSAASGNHPWPCNPREITCTIAADGKSITFQPCGMTSHNPSDVEQRYCIRCHRWMDLVELARQMTEPGYIFKK